MISAPPRPSLNESQHPLIQKLANLIQSRWQTYLNLSSYQFPEDLGYIEGRLEDEALIIENCCYQTPQFRKLHLELAKVGRNLDILHCVMFPRPDHSLPMFGVDIVSGRGSISAAVVDLSPISSERRLPDPYLQGLAALPEISFQEVRTLPEWGDIFSEFCLFIKPTSEQEEQTFLDRVGAYLDLHCQIAIASEPETSPRAIQSIASLQRHYCEQQQKNDKTRRVLEKAFGPEWTDRYLSTMLFDCINSAA